MDRGETWANRQRIRFRQAGLLRMPVLGTSRSFSAGGTGKTLGSGGQRGISQQLRSGLAEALIGRHVEHAVAGHHPILARAANPVVLSVVLTVEVEKLGTFKRTNQIATRCLIAVAAMVVLGAAQVVDLNPLFLFAGAEVPTDDHRVGRLFDGFARVIDARHSAPDHPVDDEQIVAFHPVNRLNRLLPERRSIRGIVAGNGIAALQNDHVVDDHQVFGLAALI